MATVVAIPQLLYRSMLGVIHESGKSGEGTDSNRRPNHAFNSGNGDSGSHATTTASVNARYNPQVSEGTDSIQKNKQRRQLRKWRQ